MLYLPAIALNIAGLFWYALGEQIYFLGIDSLVLIVYATILITVVITQREKLLRNESLFEWKELLRFNVESDDEVMYCDNPHSKTETVEEVSSESKFLSE